MKRYIVFLIIWILSIFGTTNAFFWSASSLDLYKNIDTWINELDDKLFEFEINGWIKWTSILEEINELAINDKYIECLDVSKNLSIEEFKEIIQKEDLGKLWTYLNSTCSKDDTNWMKILVDYLLYFKEYEDKINTKTETKSKQIYQISNIWLYSDWKIENSWFDLISDIEEIDKIIFADVVDYEWWDNVDLGESIYWFIESIGEWTRELLNWSTDSIDLNNDSNKEENDDTINTSENSDESTIETNNTYLCSDDIQTSWLSKDNLSFILNNIDTNLNNWIIVNDSVNSNIWNWDTDNLEEEWSNNWNTDIWWGYQSITDLSEWPCNEFFCIDIEYITYDHNLFWWWENITIEYLLNRSNEHLGKFASTSLIPASMSQNNFQLWLEWLNLPDIFHIWFQISTKPVPILDLAAEDKKDEWEFALKNMLESFYKSKWLDYKRRNDLTMLNNLEQDKQSVLNAKELTVRNAFLNQQEYYNDYLINKEEKAKLFNKIIEKKVSYWVLETFEKQYTELDKFTLGINNYVQNIHSIILKLNAKPKG